MHKAAEITNNKRRNIKESDRITQDTKKLQQNARSGASKTIKDTFSKQTSSTPESTSASSPSILCNSFSEEEVNNECDTDGFTFVHFNARPCESMMKELKEIEFYAVGYVGTNVGHIIYSW